MYAPLSYAPSVRTSAEPPPAFLSRQNAGPLPIRNNGAQMNPMVGQEAFDGNFLRGNLRQERPPPDNFHFDTILPLNDGRIPPQRQFTNVSQGSNRPNFNDLNIGFSGQRQSHNDQDVVNNMFRQPVPAPSRPPVDRQGGGGAESLLQGFGAMSFVGEGGSNELGLEGADWDWEGLMNDDGASQPRVGLGGVRLDSSAELAKNMDNAKQYNRQWGM